MPISVVVPTTLTNPSCAQSLHSIARAAQGVPGSEVIVVANGPEGHRRLPVLDQVPLRLLHSPAQGPGAARNLGLREARHPVVLLTDDDCEVPPTWCAELADGLRRAGTAAACAPVGAVRVGPVTAFLDHQRVFDAPPLDRSTVAYPTTANCVFDRSRTRAGFDEDFLGAAGEDAEFGYRIREGGGDIAWLRGPSVSQLLVDDVDQVSRRFHAYGRACAQLYLGGRTSHAIAFAEPFYRNMCTANATVAGRQFRELPDPAVRQAFATLQVVLDAALLVGYLESLGEQIGHRLIDVDYQALRAGWRRVYASAARTGAGTDWSNLGADPALLRGPSDDVTGGRDEVATLLGAHAPLTPPPAALRSVVEGSGPHAAAGGIGTDQRSYAEALRAARAVATTFPAGPATIDALATHIRDAGFSFAFGMAAVEREWGNRV